MTPSNNSTATQIRIESDSLGEVRVPKDALYGAQTQRAIENYPISGRTAHPEFIGAYLNLKKATAISNGICGTLSKEESTLIQKAIDEVLAIPESRWSGIFPVDVHQAGAGTSTHMNINEVIANVANRIAGNPLGTYSPIHPNDHVNRSQSTNDTFPSAMRMSLIDASTPLVRELDLLAIAFAAKGQAWNRIQKSGRTHLQDAVPMTLGQEFTAYALTLAKCWRWLEQARDELRELGIGGSAVGTGLTVPRGFDQQVVKEVSRITGVQFRGVTDLREAMQSQSPISYYSSMLRLMALELTRICNDLRLMASGPLTGFAELILPAVQPGSSIMPGKVNPSILEMANQTWFSLLGYDQTVVMAVQAGQLELNVMMPVMIHAMLDATRIATHAIQILRERCIEGLQPNKTRLKKYFEKTPQIATALSPRLGYAQTAELVKEALAEDVSVIDLARARKLISEKELEKLLDPKTLTGTG